MTLANSRTGGADLRAALGLASCFARRTTDEAAYLFGNAIRKGKSAYSPNTGVGHAPEQPSRRQSHLIAARFAQPRRFSDLERSSIRGVERRDENNTVGGVSSFVAGGCRLGRIVRAGATTRAEVWGWCC